MIVDMLSHTGMRKGNDFKVEELLGLMDENGIDRCMTCSQVENINNLKTSQTAMRYPDRIIGFAVVNPWAIDGEKELERCFGEYGLKGLKLNCLRFAVSADRHSILDPYFDICSKHKAVVVAHAMSDLFSLPSKWEEMAGTFPDVPVILSHMGVPMMVDAAFRIAKRNENIFLNTAACFAPVLKRAIEEVGPEKIVFSSDTPYGSMRQELQKLRFVTSDTGVLRLILGENALRLLGMP